VVSEFFCAEQNRDGKMSQGPQHALQRKIGLFSATNLVMANMVGTGIFTTSGFIMGKLQDPTALLLCWLAGGVLALCGALCYAELGANFPQAGGEYVFLRHSFGPIMAFLSGWISLTVGFSAPIAAASIAFSTYLWPIIGPENVPALVYKFDGITLLTFSIKEGIAIGVILVLTLVHFFGLKFGSKVQNGLTLIKLGIVGIFIGAGFWIGQGDWSNFHASASSSSLWQGEFAVSLIFVAFAYSGWNAAAYLGAEIKNPDRNIPLALIVGTSIVCGLYLLVNILYVYSLSPEEMGGVLNVGALAASSLFGPSVGVYFSLAITLCLLSLISAMIMTGPRVYYAMARDGLFFPSIARVSGSRHTPGGAIFLQASIAALLVLTASFEKLLIYIGFTLSITSLLTVVGLMRLRRRSDLTAKYRTFGYPVTPMLFILANLWIVVYCLATTPQAPIGGLITIGLGLIFFQFFKRRKGV
jgi:basic amino acid/polyamine antiporter, APA family